MVELEATGAEAAKTQSNANLCRLCLKQDDFVIDIFEDHVDEQQQQKTPLAKRLFDFFQIKYERSSDFPNCICQRCLYMVEAFTRFRLNVRKSELKLQKRAEVEALQKTASASVPTDTQRAGLNGCPGIFEPDEKCIITVVDPEQEYESSDDDFSMDSDFEAEDEEETTSMVTNQKPTTVTATMTNTQVATSIAEETLATPTAAVDLPIKTEPSLNPLPVPLETLAMEFTKNTFLCQYCDMAFTTQLDCVEHESRHDPISPFICNFCPFRTANRQNLIYHIKEMHDHERPYVCALCNKGFCRRSDLKKHTIVHTGVRPFTCPVCAKSFSRNTNLTKHMRIHSGVKPHVCVKCPRSFTTAGELVRHSRSHAEVKPFQCSKCPASFTRKDKLQLHEQAHYRKESEFLINQSKTASTMENPKRTPAPMENIVVSLNPYGDINTQHDANYFSQDSNSQRIPPYATHTSDVPLTTSGIQPQVPQQQPSRFPTQFMHSNAPVVDVATIDPYRHSILAAQLQQSRPTGRNTPVMLPLPLQQPHADKPKIAPKTSHPRNVTCEICSKTFTRERDLQRHQALHLDKLFTCKHCGRGFNRREKLVRHEQLEHEQRPQYSCDQCRITFSKREALTMHMKVHELQQNMTMTQVALNAATNNFPGGDSTATAVVGDLLQQRLSQQAASASDISFYRQMVPTMNLGFYSETKPEDRNGI